MTFEIFNTYYNVSDKGFFKFLYDLHSADYENLLGVYDIAIDVYLMSKIGDKQIQPFYTKLFDTDNEAYEKIASVIHKLYYKVWKRVVDVMNENYNVFDVAVEKYNEQSRIENIVAVNNSTQTENKVNAFDSENASNSDSSNTVNAGNTNGNENRVMSYEKTSTGALYTPMELLQREIDVRQRFNIYDVFIKDIAKTLCIDIY